MFIYGAGEWAKVAIKRLPDYVQVVAVTDGNPVLWEIVFAKYSDRAARVDNAKASGLHFNSRFIKRGNSDDTDSRGHGSKNLSGC